MILGMTTATFTAIHVALSLIGIATGLVAAFGMIADRPLPWMTAVFLATTAATSVTGFLFPYHGVTPGIILGILSLVVLLVATMARYAGHMRGGWRGTWVVTAMMALYFNFFVLIVQSFEKVPALRAMALHPGAWAFRITQLLALLGFTVLTVLALKNFEREGRAAR